jgi:hypothetical protein
VTALSPMGRAPAAMSTHAGECWPRIGSISRPHQSRHTQSRRHTCGPLPPHYPSGPSRLRSCRRCP